MLHPVEVITEPDAGSAPSQASANGTGHAELARVADELLPALIARLGASELGELEVREDGWRVRLRRGAAPGATAAPVPAATRTTADRGASHGTPTGSGPAASRQPAARRTATSPGVGYFSPRDGLIVGLPVKSGDILGHIDVLGVRQDVLAPVDGIVGRILATTGEAVEYGQELVRVDGMERVQQQRGEGMEPGEPDVEAPETRAAD